MNIGGNLASLAPQHTDDWFAANAPQNSVQAFQQARGVQLPGLAQPAGGGTSAAGLFSPTSTYQDLLNALNGQHAAPGSQQFSDITGQYTRALGLSGGPGNGFDYGQLDPGRNKVYVPGGYDLRYENGQWNPHPEGPGVGAAGSGGDPLAQLQNSPGYQFRYDQGLKGLQASAAAKGTLLTGGTLKGITRYGQDYASGEYGNRVNQLTNLAQLGRPT